MKTVRVFIGSSITMLLAYRLGDANRAAKKQTIIEKLKRFFEV